MWNIDTDRGSIQVFRFSRIQPRLWSISRAVRGTGIILLGIFLFKGHGSANERQTTRPPEEVGMLRVQRHVVQELDNAFCTFDILFDNFSYTGCQLDRALQHVWGAVNGEGMRIFRGRITRGRGGFQLQALSAT